MNLLVTKRQLMSTIIGNPLKMPKLTNTYVYIFNSTSKVNWPYQYDRKRRNKNNNTKSDD